MILSSYICRTWSCFKLLRVSEVLTKRVGRCSWRTWVCSIFKYQRWTRFVDVSKPWRLAVSPWTGDFGRINNVSCLYRTVHRTHKTSINCRKAEPDLFIEQLSIIQFPWEKHSLHQWKYTRTFLMLIVTPSHSHTEAHRHTRYDMQFFRSAFLPSETERGERGPRESE